jgi:hypothetical protein
MRRFLCWGAPWRRSRGQTGLPATGYTEGWQMEQSIRLNNLIKTEHASHKLVTR